MTKEMAALVAKMEAIQSDPKNRNTVPDSIYLYTKNARRRLDKIGWQITHLLMREREAAGRPVDQSGYSGRQTNRR